MTSLSPITLKVAAITKIAGCGLIAGLALAPLAPTIGLMYLVKWVHGQFKEENGAVVDAKAEHLVCCRGGQCSPPDVADDSWTSATA